ncbi:MAG: DNA polymerase III subunit beta [Candidatus Parcubacteria bacterium]|nr:MAG: DNA polymerase III subunit beta [Candidatus Parcubacteria bacterium]
MRVNLLTSKLREILQIVNSVCPQKSDLNILNYFYISADDSNNEIYIAATDLEINYQTKFPARVIKKGHCLIPARQLEKVIDNFYEEEIELETKDDLLLIKGENSISSLPGLSQENFPSFSKINFDQYFEIDNELFESYLEKLLPILSTSDIKPEYSGIYFDLKETKLNLVATDTIRLAVQRVNSQFFETNLKKISILIPKRLIQEFKEIKRKSGKLRIYFEENQITFEILNHLLTSKLLEINYPDYTQFISPSNFLFTFLVNKVEILKALKLSRVFADQSKGTELKFILYETDKTNLEIYSKNDLLGENKNSLKIEIKDNNLPDQEFTIKFHLDFLYDGFNVFDDELVWGGFFSGLGSDSTPLYLRSPIDDDFIYISNHR